MLAGRGQTSDNGERTDVKHRHVYHAAIVTAAMHFVVHRETDATQLALPDDATLRGTGGAAGEQ